MTARGARRGLRCLTAATAAAGLAVAAGGCGSSNRGAGPGTPTSRLVRVPGSPAGKIILTATGAERIGVQTVSARRAPAAAGAGVTVPASSIVYDPSGRTFAFTESAPLTYSEVRVSVDHFGGAVVYLRRGPKPGSRVVTVGAQELLGVQTGVLDQT